MKTLLVIIVALASAPACLAPTTQRVGRMTGPSKPGPEMTWVGERVFLRDRTCSEPPKRPADGKQRPTGVVTQVEWVTNDSRITVEFDESHARLVVLGSQNCVQLQLHDAVFWRDKERVAQLLASGANVNVRDMLDDTPLFVAIDQDLVERRNVDVVELLLANGADVQATRNAVRESTLMAAVDNWNTAAAELLLAHGADVNAENYYGHTALHTAAWDGQAKMTALLLAKGANVNAKLTMSPYMNPSVTKGDTPLHIAAVREGEFLRAHRTPLPPQQAQYVASVGIDAYVETAALLLANGADVNATNAKGKTPLRLAASREMKALLKKHGAK